MRVILRNKEIKHNKEISHLTKKDKETVILEQQSFDKGTYNVNVILERYFDKRRIIDDSCGIDDSKIAYRVFFFIQYDELKTQDHNEQIFFNLNESQSCYKEYVKRFKSENINNTFKTMMNEMNSKIKELNERIKFFENKL